MKTSTLIWVIVVLVVIAGAWFWMGKDSPVVQQAIAEYKNATYIIEGQPVTLINGRAETDAVPGSASKILTEYFGNDATGDLNGDGVADVGFLLTQDTGGSGTFYYAVAAIKIVGGYTGTSAVLLGDRIAPQTTEIRNGQLLVNYADRAQGESFAVQPSVGKSLWLKLDPATLQFGEVVQNFEGETNPATMTLSMQTWTWISTLYSDDTTVTPKKTKAFTLTFKKDGSFSATTDCNSMGGTYTAKENKISFGQIASTLMFCADSQESDFAKMLQESQTYHFTSKGELVFDLKLDSGSFIFR